MINTTHTETPDQGMINVANAFLKKVFNSTAGYVVVKSKNSPGNLVVNIDSHLLSMESINAKIIPRGVKVKSVARGMELQGDLESIRKIINICKNQQ